MSSPSSGSAQAFATFIAPSNALTASNPAQKVDASGNTVYVFNLEIPASPEKQNLHFHFTLPPPQINAPPSKDPEAAKSSLEEQAKSGKVIPERLQKCVDFLGKANKWTLYTVGTILSVLGIIVLVAGTVYCCYVFGKNISKIKEIGVFGLVSELIKTGAMPTVLFGGAMLHFGRGLMKNELSNASLLSFVTPFYGLLFPMDMGTSAGKNDNPWKNN